MISYFRDFVIKDTLFIGYPGRVIYSYPLIPLVNCF